MKLDAKSILMIVVYALALYGLIQLIRGLTKEQYMIVDMCVDGVTKANCNGTGEYWDASSNCCRAPEEW